MLLLDLSFLPRGFGYFPDGRSSIGAAVPGPASLGRGGHCLCSRGAVPFTLLPAVSERAACSAVSVALSIARPLNGLATVVCAVLLHLDC